MTRMDRWEMDIPPPDVSRPVFECLGRFPPGQYQNPKQRQASAELHAAKDNSTFEVVAAECVSNTCNAQRRSEHLYGAAVNGNYMYVIQDFSSPRSYTQLYSMPTDDDSNLFVPPREVAAVEYISNTLISNQSNVHQLRVHPAAAAAAYDPCQQTETGRPEVGSRHAACCGAHSAFWVTR